MMIFRFSKNSVIGWQILIRGKHSRLALFLRKHKTAPYGVGGTPLMLSLAHVIRAYGERLIVYKDSTRMVEQPLQIL